MIKINFFVFVSISVLFPVGAACQPNQPLRIPLEYYITNNRKGQYELLRQYLEKALGSPVAVVTAQRQATE
jgi:hypothetical protein